MRRSARLVIHSTTLPETCRLVAEQARVRGLSFIEAPVSGGAPGAMAGTMTVMTAGDQQAVEDARPVFETFAQRIFHLGEVGCAQMAKLINNSLMAANMGLAHHAISAGTDLGIDREALRQLLGASSGRSFALEVYVRQRDAGFAQAGTLFEKIELLGQVIGYDHPAYLALRDAAAPILDMTKR